jgi:hypothetical protein
MPNTVYVCAMIYLVLYKLGKGNIEGKIPAKKFKKGCFDEPTIKSGHYGF